MKIPRLSVIDAIVFIVPLLTYLDIHIIGRLYAPDIMLLMLFPFLLARSGRLLKMRLPKTFLTLGFIWLLGQMGTDLVQETNFTDFSRGWAKIIFTLINFCSIYLLIIDNPKRIVLFTAGLAAGGALDYFLTPSLLAQVYPWKFGYGRSITLTLVLLAVAVTGQARYRLLYSIAVLGFASALNFYLGSRAIGGICALTASLITIQIIWARRNVLKFKVRPSNLIIIGVVMVVSFLAVLKTYEYAAGSGLLGNYAKRKYERQSAGDYGLLLGGRSEILASLQAIADSPVIGHGSWAKDCYYARLGMTLKEDLGYFSTKVGKECLIPTHSHLFGSWVEAGLLGAVFWIWVLTLLIRVLGGLYKTRDRLTPLVAFSAFFLIWNILFSQYGGTGKFITPYHIVVIIIYLQTYVGFRHPHIK